MVSKITGPKQKGDAEKCHCQSNQNEREVIRDERKGKWDGHWAPQDRVLLKKK